MGRRNVTYLQPFETMSEVGRRNRVDEPCSLASPGKYGRTIVATRPVAKVHWLVLLILFADDEVRERRVRSDHHCGAALHRAITKAQLPLLQKTNRCVSVVRFSKRI